MAPWLDSALKTVPIAALTTVFLGAVLAPWIARRQESGKEQAAAEAELRTLIVELRADAMYARQGLDTHSTYDPERFTGVRLADFTVQVVAAAQKLPKRRQRRVVAALITLVGKWRVCLAEEIGPAWRQGNEEFRDENAPNAVALQAARMHRQQEQERVLYERRKTAMDFGDQDNGLLGMMEESQLPDLDHPKAISAVDALLTAVGGAHRLGETWISSKILRRKAPSLR